MKTVDFNNIDYFPSYIVNGRLDLPRLINDDFFLAIKICYNSGYYTSATKLLMCFIDTISYISFGTSSGKSFQEYLDRYCDLKKVGITSLELWEHRNGILHMTNLESRKITKGEVKRLISYVGTLTDDICQKICAKIKSSCNDLFTFNCYNEWAGKLCHERLYS